MLLVILSSASLAASPAEGIVGSPKPWESIACILESPDDRGQSRRKTKKVDAFGSDAFLGTTLDQIQDAGISLRLASSQQYNGIPIEWWSGADVRNSPILGPSRSARSDDQYFGFVDESLSAVFILTTGKEAWQFYRWLDKRLGNPTVEYRLTLDKQPIDWADRLGAYSYWNGNGVQVIGYYREPGDLSAGVFGLWVVRRRTVNCL